LQNAAEDPTILDDQKCPLAVTVAGRRFDVEIENG
jgi:hypothetical protein